VKCFSAVALDEILAFIKYLGGKSANEPIQFFVTFQFLSPRHAKSICYIEFKLLLTVLKLCQALSIFEVDVFAAQ